MRPWAAGCGLAAAGTGLAAGGAFNAIRAGAGAGSVATEAAAATGARDIAVIGRQADTEIAENWAGHEVLNLPPKEWSIPKNDEWVQSVIDRKMDVYVGSNPTFENMWDVVKNRPTVFSRELSQFRAAGYTWDGWTLRAPGG